MVVIVPDWGGGVHADGVRQIGRQVGEHGVEADRIQHAGSEADDQSLEMVVEQLGERGEHAALGSDLTVGGGGALGLKRIVHRLVDGGISELGADVQHNQTERAGQQERHTPSPTDHRARVHVGGHQRGQSRTGEQTDSGGSRNQRAVDAAL